MNTQKKRRSQLCRTGNPLEGWNANKEEPTPKRELPSPLRCPFEISNVSRTRIEKAAINIFLMTAKIQELKIVSFRKTYNILLELYLQ